MPSDVLARIRARGPIGMRLGLGRVRALLARLGDPQDELRGALVAGTNGKGSTTAMTAAILSAAGYSTSRSPSPHLQTYLERVTVDERPIDPDDLDALLEEVLGASEPCEAEHGPATEFELFTAAFYLWSARRHVDVVVMEVGLGGRLDASNAWAADVAAVTNVGLDHSELLGPTLASIATEKAAIIKPGSRAVTGATGDALDVIAERATAVGAPLMVCPPLPVLRMDLDGLVLHEPHLGELRLSLLGRHQAQNAAVALGIVAALEAAGVARVTDDAIAAGLAGVRWPARLELLHPGDGSRSARTVLLDGAHNPDGAAALAAALEELEPQLEGGIATVLLGVLADKDVNAIVTALARCRMLRLARCIATRVPDTDRALGARELAGAWDRAMAALPTSTEVGPDDVGAAVAIDDVDEALDHALELALESGGPLIVTGSLYLVGHVRARLVPDAWSGAA